MAEDRYALVGGRVISGGEIHPDVAVVVAGVIEAVVPLAALTPGTRRVDVGGRYVTPGLIDLHAHGAAGSTFATPDEAAYDAVLDAHVRAGVTAIQASLASAPIPELVDTLRFVATWRRRTSTGATLIGAHLEGPFLAMAQRGAHAPDALRPPDPDAVTQLLDHSEALTMVTLAPELAGAHEATRRFVASGAVVAAGHSEASGADLAAAQDAGLTHLTHLWSGQSSTRREGPWRVPGLLEESLASDGLTAEVIADGAHLPPALLRVAHRCLAGRLCVVSDATAGAGLPEGSHYTLGTVPCVVRDGVGMVLGADSFAGSTTLLNRMVHHLHAAADIPLPVAVAMATEVPATVLGLSDHMGRLAPGYDADIAVFDDNFIARATVVKGEWRHDDLGLAPFR
jgi:N-acetylglucosamine-6-phosphate deacetylase